jgi:CheY-like chemotaxis protein
VTDQDKVDILLVDDQPAKLLSYEAILDQVGENLIKAGSATEALEQLLKRNVAIILIDVCMPDLDGFQLATMIREHPRFQKTAIIFVSAIQVTDLDLLRGWTMFRCRSFPSCCGPRSKCSPSSTARHGTSNG